MGTDESKILGAYYDSQRNVITLSSGTTGSITFYDVTESGQVSETGRWDFEDSNSVLRSYSQIRGGVF